MLRVVAAMAALAVGATVVLAQNAAVIDQRKQAMKAMGGAAKEPGAMAKGKALFPDDSKTGDTAALPVAFEKKADVMDRFDKMAAAAKAAAGAIKDEASFKTEWPKVLSNCGGCHKEYRKPPAKK